MDDLDRALAGLRRDYEPDAHAPARVRVLLATSLSVVGTSAGAAAGSESIAPLGGTARLGSGMVKGMVKATLATLALGGAVAAGVHLGSAPAPAPNSPRPTPTVALDAPSTPVPQTNGLHAAGPEPSLEVEAARAPPTPMPVQLTRDAAAAERRGHTLEELQLLSAASRALRAGDLAEAERALKDHQERYPKSALAQERHGLALEVRCARGSTDAVRAEAQRFVDRAAGSPMAASVRKQCLE